MPTLITADNLAANTITPEKIASTVALGGPKIANVQIANSSWSVLDDTAVDTAGGYVIVNGSGFSSGCQVLINNTPATSVTRHSSNQLRVQVPAKDANTYVMYVVNPDGGTAVGVNALTYSGSPVWVTGSTLANVVTNVAYSYSLTATGATSYSLQPGSSLPSNSTLASNGLFTGNTNVNSNTTYSFTVEAIDNENQNSPRTFSLLIATTVEILATYMAVAGGGGGGGNRGGGGGAGGYLSANAAFVKGLQYNITIGAGGSGQSPSVNSTQGGNTTISGSGVAVEAVGGGRGGGNINGATPYVGGNGGSGGAAGSSEGYATGKGIYPGSSYISGTRQGYDAGTVGNMGAGAGGGGAGGAGGNSSSSLSGGSGGPGVTGLDGSTYSAGGSGGNASDNSGGGASGNNNTGNGGGGGSGNINGGAGGSGVVIIRTDDSAPVATSTTGSPTISTSGGYRYYKFTSNGTITF